MLGRQVATPTPKRGRASPAVASERSFPRIRSAGCVEVAASSLGSTGLESLSRASSPKHGRFHLEELECFRPLPSPSALWRQKAEVYWQSTGEKKASMSASGAHTLPLNRGPFFNSTMLEHGVYDEVESPKIDRNAFSVSSLRWEDRTATVLDRIYPKDSFQSVRLGDTQRSSSSRPAENQRFLQQHKRTLEKLLAAQSAFAAFAIDVADPETNLVRRKDFDKFLTKHLGELTPQEQDKIFRYLDLEKSGGISPKCYLMAVEAASPARSVEDLRRKLIALGFTSMRKVINKMNVHRDMTRRLREQEFVTLMARVGLDESEACCIFNAIRDPNNSSNTASLSELSAGISGISPSLLLEDIRDRIVRTFGSLKAGYAAIDFDLSAPLTLTEFIRYGTQTWGMTPFEVRKAFRLIDIDGNMKILRSEFISALSLCEPTLYLEDIRRKVRQRLRDIQDALCHDSATNSRRPVGKQALDALRLFRATLDEEAVTRTRTPSEYQDILQGMHMAEQDVQKLFELVDIDRDGVLLPDEFLKGVRIFAPTSILEDLRALCLRDHGRVADAFLPLSPEQREATHDLPGLTKLLEELDIARGIDVHGLLDLIESHSSGGVTVGELIAALQAAAPPGFQVPLSEDQQRVRARLQVRWQMAPFQRNARELRTYCRMPLGDDAPAVNSPGSVRRRSASPPRPAARAGGAPEAPQDLGAHLFPSPDPMKNPRIKNSYSKVTRAVTAMDKKSGEIMLEQLDAYYVAAGSQVNKDEELLQKQKLNSLQPRGLNKSSK